MRLFHSDYMKLCLDEAKIAYSLGEIPVGALIVKEGEIIASPQHPRNRAQRPRSRRDKRYPACLAKSSIRGGFRAVPFMLP